jgi:hypothetical protein
MPEIIQIIWKYNLQQSITSLSSPICTKRRIRMHHIAVLAPWYHNISHNTYIFHLKATHPQRSPNIKGRFLIDHAYWVPITYGLVICWCISASFCERYSYHQFWDNSHNNSCHCYHNDMEVNRFEKTIRRGWVLSVWPYYTTYDEVCEWRRNLTETPD